MDHLTASINVDSGMTAVTVRAHLANGLAQAAPWGVALDGLLAAELWSSIKARSREQGHEVVPVRDQDEPPDLDLPLARCTTEGDWHWAATCALPDTPAPRTDVRHWMSHFDYRHDELVVEPPPTEVSDLRGRYRARRMPLIVNVCRSVTWRGVGHRQRIEELLQPVVSIGKKRHVGEGHVLRWEVTDTPDDLWEAAHLHPDGTLGRPTPAGCLSERLDVVDGGEGTAGIRPPYVHPARQRHLHLPTFLDADQ